MIFLRKLALEPTYLFLEKIHNLLKIQEPTNVTMNKKKFNFKFSKIAAPQISFSE